MRVRVLVGDRWDGSVMGCGGWGCNMFALLVLPFAAVWAGVISIRLGRWLLTSLRQILVRSLSLSSVLRRAWFEPLTLKWWYSVLSAMGELGNPLCVTVSALSVWFRGRGGRFVWCSLVPRNPTLKAVPRTTTCVLGLTK